MRDYGAVSPQFWIGNTGKALRGQVTAQLVALYLMTSPHANMIGVFYCPIDYIAKETGLPLEGASEALRSLKEANFCMFDEATEEVFVRRMAAFQIGERLDAKDNRCKGVARELDKVSSAKLQSEFRATYSIAFHLPKPLPEEPKGTVKTASPLQAPPKPETGAGAIQEQDKGTASPSAPPPAPPAAPAQPATATPIDSRGSRLPAEWTLPVEWAEWCAANRPDLDPKAVAEGFRDFWVSKPGKDGRKSDWLATWRNWCRGQARGKGRGPGGADDWTRAAT